MNDYEGPQIVPIITWHSKVNRTRIKHAFSQAGGWSLCGAVGYSETGPDVKGAEKCKRCEKIAKRSTV